MSGRDLRHEPLSIRRAELERSIYESDELILSRRLSANGLAAFRVAKQRGYEGVVAKRLASVYVEGRSREWLKVKVNQEDEFIILGYTAPSGSRKYFGALLLGAFKNGKIQYVGRVGRASLGMFSPRFIANFSRSNENSALSSAPELGQHTKETLSDWFGMDSNELSHLQAAGVILQGGM